MFGGVPAEEEQDFRKPNKIADLSFWVIPDSKGMLKGVLHYCRRYEYCRDVIVLTSKKTPKEYHTYLQERKYDYYVVGEDKVLIDNFNIMPIKTPDEDLKAILG